MIDADKSAFVASLTELAMLKGQKLTTQQFTAWWNALRYDWQLEEFQRACARLSQDCEFMPNPYHFAQLRKVASTETAAEAWPLVVQAIQTGRHDGVSEHAQRVVRAMGGWRHLATQPTDTRHFRERRFVELWAELAESDQARHTLPSLAPRIGGPASIQQLLKAGP